MNYLYRARNKKEKLYSMLPNREFTDLTIESLSQIKGGTNMVSRGAWYMQTPAQRRSFGKGFRDGWEKAFS